MKIYTLDFLERDDDRVFLTPADALSALQDEWRRASASTREDTVVVEIYGKNANSAPHYDLFATAAWELDLSAVDEDTLDTFGVTSEDDIRALPPAQLRAFVSAAMGEDAAEFLDGDTDAERLPLSRYAYGKAIDEAVARHADSLRGYEFRGFDYDAGQDRFQQHYSRWDDEEGVAHEITVSVDAFGGAARAVNDDSESYTTLSDTFVWEEE